MFTGIVKDIGRVARIDKRGRALRLAVEAGSADFADLQIDESVNISGACQTVVSIHDRIFEVDTVEETIKKTTLGNYRIGTRVNLERALRPVDRMGGHVVQGHIDGTGEIVSLEKNPASWIYRIAFPAEFEPLIVPIGSVAVDGVSLTVAEVTGAAFRVAIIPYTFRNTTLYERKAGDKVNLEFDILGKYIQKQLAGGNAYNPLGNSSAAETKPEMSEAWLRKLGY